MNTYLQSKFICISELKRPIFDKMFIFDENEGKQNLGLKTYQLLYRTMRPRRTTGQARDEKKQR